MGTFDRVVSRRAFGGLAGAALSCMTAGGVSRAVAPQRREEGTVPANARVTEDAFAAHIEPALAVNPRDPDNLLATCRVFVGPDIGLATYTSFDGGNTWQEHGLLPGLVPDYDGNPTVAFDGHGHGFVCGVVASQGPSRQGDALLWRTDDGGRSFRPPLTAIAGGIGLVDHPWLAIGTGRRPSPAPLYVAARMYGTTDDGVVLARSMDGGRAFESPRALDPATGAQATAPVAAAGPDGSLTVVYGARSLDGGVALRAVSSDDHGGSFTAPHDVAEVPAMAPDLGDVTAKSGPALAAAPASGLMCAALTGFDDATGLSRLLLTTSTTSAGQTPLWSEPMTIAASDETVFLQPQVAVDDSHRIAISVYALSVTTLLMDVLLLVSDPARSATRPPTFAPPLRVTTRSFDPRQAIGTGSTHWLGNYQGLAAAAGHVFHPIWTDTRTGRTQIFTAAVRPHGRSRRACQPRARGIMSTPERGPIEPRSAGTDRPRTAR
ncbi:sialidase family protein [Streptomyces sp. NPDC086777]|uniref:sialidase family protein n=1 Tax=Streptomyces sp. NPDC086777 TaxID=3154866 RepID=UPI003450DDA9